MADAGQGRDVDKGRGGGRSGGGVRMPEELSVIGMDDTFLCQASTPPLSTIRVHRREMGRIAVNLLLHTVPLAHSSVVKTELGVDLIERGSVAAPCR